MLCNGRVHNVLGGGGGGGGWGARKEMVLNFIPVVESV